MNWSDARRVTVFTLYCAFGWIIGLTILAVALVRGARFLMRLLAALAPTTNCAHCQRPVAQYARWRCRCGAASDGWAWRCSNCRAFAGWVACEHCAMGVTNPLLRE
ncbi:MAG: hypothetical protein WCK01_00425 [Candidatus Uhrbacteria bacterium]